jgi:hypothetical protein
VIVSNQTIDFVRAIMPNHSVTVRLHFVKVFDGALMPIIQGNQRVSWHTPQRRFHLFSRAVHYPNVNQADYYVSLKVPCMRRNDVVAVSVSPGRIDTKAADVVDSTLQAIPSENADIVPPVNFWQFSQPGE